MSLSNEIEQELVCQLTQHAMLVAWGRFAQYLQVRERLRQAVTSRRHKDAIAGGDLVLEFALASLAGYEYLQDLNLGPHPLVKDQAVADAWGMEFSHYSTVSRFLYKVSEAVVDQVQAELEAIMRPYLHQQVHQVLCQQGYLTLCGDLTGRPVSAYSTTYPPDAVFGYMANQLCKGYQLAVVTCKGLTHRVHVAAFCHSGETVSSQCLQQLVEAAESRLGCRPRRRVELVRQRLTHLEAKIAQKQAWCHSQQATIRDQLDRQLRINQRLQQLQTELMSLEASPLADPNTPSSRLNQLRQQQQTKSHQLQAALQQEAAARRVLRRHQDHLTALQAQREALLQWLANLELDNVSLPHPVRMRWLLDGGFGDSHMATYLIELGYDFYTIAHGGKITPSLLKQVAAEADWAQVSARTEALSMGQGQLGQCPYPVSLTLLRWRSGETLKHTTLVSFSDQTSLPLAELFPTYHHRQDVEAAIKQGKSTFGLTKLRLRSAAGIRLLAQFALVFWPNFVHWAADWLSYHLHDEAGHLRRLLSQVRPQVRIAANTPALVMTNSAGQCLQFDPDGPFAGATIQLDGPFAYQFPMPLFQSWQQLWPISSMSVKDQVATFVAYQQSTAPALSSMLQCTS
jgi:hypothetical protein